MVIRLYDLELTDRKAAPRRHFGRPSVRAVPSAGLSGHYDPSSGTVVCADRAAVREALPYRLRPAFDRALVWYPSRPGEPVSTTNEWHAYADLKGCRGGYLGTVRMVPRVESTEEGDA